MKVDLARAFGRDSQPLAQFQGQRLIEAKLHTAIRVMDRFPDFVLHVALPSDQLRERMTTGGPAARREYIVTVATDIASLRDDRDFKTMIKDVESLVDDLQGLEIPPLVHAYVSSLGRTHAVLRTYLKSEVMASDRTIVAARRRIEKRLKRRGIDAANMPPARVEDTGNPTKSAQQYVSMMLIERREELEAHNPRPDQLQLVGSALTIGVRRTQRHP